MKEDVCKNQETHNLKSSTRTSSSANDLYFESMDSYPQTENELHNHKSLLMRGESICKMGYWEYNLKNDKLWASHGARTIYGFNGSEISLNDIKNIVFPDFRQALDLSFERLIEKNERHDVEFKIYRQTDGDIIDIKSHAEYDKEDKKIYGVIQDVTLKKKTDQELIHAKEKAEESERLKNAFVSNMSHEIRTPMNGIVGFAHLLTETDSNDDSYKEYKEHIHQCCNQLLDKVNDILDISKIESGQVVVNTGNINISKFLNNIVENFTSQVSKKNLVLNYKPTNSPDEIVLITDGVKLNKIIINLLENAVRFTHSGYIEFGYHLTDTEIIFHVKDTGIGISPSHHEIIFKPFCQAHSKISQDYGGTGLGLSIAKTYVNMLGGRIWLESQLSEGTTFFFALPNNCNQKNIFAKPFVRKKLNQPKLSLIVEDMEMNYIYLKALLEPLGFSAIWAKDGNEAIKMAFENKNIDLILMDIRLPNTDGYEATRIIKGIRPNLPIIAQTANALADERKKALESGCNDYITKPIYKDSFIKTLSIYFEI
jgi:PAS domain S-box-containing protein